MFFKSISSLLVAGSIIGLASAASASSFDRERGGQAGPAAATNAAPTASVSFGGMQSSTMPTGDVTIAAPAGAAAQGIPTTQGTASSFDRERGAGAPAPTMKVRARTNNVPPPAVEKYTQ